MVFVEYAVNDNSQSTDLRMKSREGLLRKLLKTGSCDVVLVYTYCQAMFSKMNEGSIPESISEFEQLAEHYGLNSVWMAMEAFTQYKKGLMRYEEWLPDGLHPQNFGSSIYSRSVCDFLKQALSKERHLGARESKYLPKSLMTDNWENAYLYDLSQMKKYGPWLLYRSHSLVWTDLILYTSSAGSRMEFKFDGTGAILFNQFGKLSSELKYSVDGGESVTTVRERQEWMGEQGYPCATILGQNLESGLHTVEIEVVHSGMEGRTGTICEVLYIGILR